MTSEGGSGEAGRDVTSQPLERVPLGLEEEAARQAARFQILAEASHAFAEVALDYDALLEEIARRAAEILGDGAIVNLVSEDGAWVRPVAMDTGDPELSTAYQAMLAATPGRVGEGVAGRVIAQNAPVLVPVVSPEAMAEASRPEYRSVVRRLAVHSLLVVPMRLRGAPIGAFTLFRRRPGCGYDEADQALLQDLADRAALAVENARLHASLELRVAQRTADLEAAMRELEAFSYSVSHDLRAPLRGINGFSAALLEDLGDRLDDRSKDYLARICAGTVRMGLLIDALIRLSKVSRTELQRDDVDLTALARAEVAHLRAADPERVVELVVAEDLTARGDPQLLRVLLENLLGNAWKFASKRVAARIEVGCDREAAEPVFHVTDNGAGFDMAYADRLFVPFQRLHAADEFPGTGIGLATVRRIVERHGGRIWAGGAVGRGATFRFTLGPKAG